MGGLFKFIAGCGLHLRYCRWHAVITALLAFALGSAECGFAQPARPKENTPATFQPEARKHVSPKRPEEPIDMNPLHVAGCFGELVDALLGYLHPATHRHFLAEAVTQLLYVLEFCFWHQGNFDGAWQARNARPTPTERDRAI